MKSKWRMPHPATMFFLFTLAVIFLSWIFDIYGLRVQLPQTGAEIRVQSLLSPEGIRWMLRNAITNFTGFAPLGMVLIAMFGIGVAQHSGFIDACVRQGVKNRKNTRRIILWVIILGLLYNIASDSSHFVLFGRIKSGSGNYYRICFGFLWLQCQCSAEHHGPINCPYDTGSSH